MPSPHPAVPYISIVVVARNADAAANLRGFVEAWIPLGPASELIVVSLGSLSPITGVQVIEVSVDVYESAARNAGIRQARGEFILSTAIDIAPSAELLQFLASRQLRKDRLYRVDLHEGDRLHAREGSFSLTPEGLRKNPPEDITPAQSGIHFGEGWFPPERDSAGELFRWIANHAEVAVGVPAESGALALEVEPGPGVGPLPQLLQVLDSTGAKVAEWSITGRAVLQLWVPARTFRLSVPDGGRPLLNDLRILNFRVFRCDWVRSGDSQTAPQARRLPVRFVTGAGFGAFTQVPRANRLLGALGDDVFGAGIEYWGQGWHRLEESGAEKFRWVSTGAELVVRIAGRQQDLCLLVEPGPSLNGQPFHLLVRLAGGREIGRVPVNGPALVRVPLPFAPGAVTALSLSPDVSGNALPGDSRVLNFRVLACACEPSERSAADLEPSRNWTAVTVSEQPAAIDWAARLQRHRRELAEIGRPAFLHVNACEFILMDRERWLDLRGYPEADDPAAYLSALLCYSAHFAGVAEEMLRSPMSIVRLQATTPAPAPPDEDLVWLITQMRRLHAPAILNVPAYATGSEE
jgi:hypothetical protein